MLLAAGEGRRLGGPKALLDWGGCPLVAHQVRLLAGRTDPVVVVVGASAAAARAAVPPVPGVLVVENRDWATGRAGSLCAGAGALPAGTPAVLVVNVDQPLIAGVVDDLLAAAAVLLPPAGDAAFVQPAWAGRRGHPVMVAGNLLPELAAVGDQTLGLRAVLNRYWRRGIAWAVTTPAVLADLDDRQAYRRWIDELLPEGGPGTLVRGPGHTEMGSGATCPPDLH